MNMYQFVRLMNTLSSAFTNKPRRSTRAKNIVVGRALGRLGLWNRLWR